MERILRLYCVKGGQRTTLESADVEPPVLGAWHVLQMSVRGEVLSCALDGKVLLTHRMDPGSEPAWPSGRVGLWTKADSVTEFDDFTLVRLGPPSKEDAP